MDNFCNSTFWDLNITWNTNRPDFTPCFQQTVLVWIPSVFLIVLLLCNSIQHIVWTIMGNRVIISSGSQSLKPDAFNFKSLLKQRNNRLFHTKAIFICGLIIINFLNLLSNYNGQFNAEWFGDLTRTSSQILVLALLLWHKIRNVTSSGGMFLYWLLTLVCEGLVVQSSLRTDYGYVENKMTEYANPRLINFLLVVIMFQLNCWADNNPKVKHKTGVRPAPDTSASFVSKLSFYWYEELAWRGYRKPLTSSDLWDLNETESCRHQVPKFYKFWMGPADDEFKANSSKKKLKGGAFTASVKALLATFLVGSFLQFLADILTFVSPEVLKLLISFTKNKDIETWKGYFFVFLLVLSSTIQTIFHNQMMQMRIFIFIRMKTMLVSAIYRKTLRISNVARKESSIGEIVNLMSVDVHKMINALIFVDELWSSPLRIGISTCLLWYILGPSILAGMAVLTFLVPINAMLGKRAKSLQIMQMKNKDQRVKLINEILTGIKVLKLYAWEPPFKQQITEVRAKELNLLKKVAYLRSLTTMVSVCAPFIVSLVTFGTYVLMDESNVLDAEKAFVSLALFNIMKQPLVNLPETIVTVIEANVASKRVNRFLNADELDTTAINKEDGAKSKINGHVENRNKTSITIQDGTFSWENEKDCLNNINLNINRGSLVAIVGIVGSGKSSLLSAILGEMVMVSGTVSKWGKVAYVSQQPWIQNCSLRDNILFGKEFDAKIYQQVIQACALQPDIDILPAGDRTEIGEKGVNLSGGQKQRVAIARAVYSNAEIYLLDDPMAAVDAHVGQHLFEQVLGPRGLLRKSTRLLVTHGVKYLKHVDDILVIKNGNISEKGTYEKLVDCGGAFSEFLSQYSHDSSNDDDKPNDKYNTGTIISSERGTCYSRQFSTSSNASLKSHHSSTRRRSDSTVSATSAISSYKLSNPIGIDLDDTEPENPAPEYEKLIQTEKTEVGSVNRHVYAHFIQAMGWPLAVMSIWFNASYQALLLGSSVWLAGWANDNTTTYNGNSPNIKYLAVYGAFGVGQAITTMIGTVAMSLALLQAASQLHKNMLSHILSSSMMFFETTPIGRIVNRFSKDVDTVDSNLPSHIRFMLQALFSLLAILTIITFNTPLFLCAVIPLGLAYYFISKFHIASKRQLKRMGSASMSPIFSMFSETLTGTATIRAYGAENRFIQELENKVDYHQKCFYPSMVANRWLAIRLDGIANLVVFFAGLLAVLGRESLDPGIVGLSISYAMQVTTTLTWLVRMAAEVETDGVAVERIMEYGQDIEQEADWECRDNKPDSNWPDKGAISFKTYSTRYRPGLDLALRNVTCEILPREKIGVVGRTGSGKSSMTLALFRILEPISGSIFIDGIDISTLGLHDIRGRITIIPQDPVMFSGSFRMNLDPFQEYLDSDIWHVLELACLKSFVSHLPGQLLYPIIEGGDNLSVGQKQLVCLARALLRRTKILVLDEATASIDLETDEMIQQTIRTEFKNCTVLTIAHRLNTILDSDRVMVLDYGQVTEFDTPQNLLQNENSAFFSLAKTAGVSLNQHS